MSDKKIKVTVWNEFRHKKENDKVKAIYPQGMHVAIGEMLKNEGDFEVTYATLDDPEHGLVWIIGPVSLEGVGREAECQITPIKVIAGSVSIARPTNIDTLFICVFRNKLNVLAQHISLIVAIDNMQRQQKIIIANSWINHV